MTDLGSFVVLGGFILALVASYAALRDLIDKKLEKMSGIIVDRFAEEIKSIHVEISEVKTQLDTLQGEHNVLTSPIRGGLNVIHRHERLG